ncbi:hypothetical protein HY490_04075, partial [Candidatus Woesearchaeota archaeon]|nr:hypothetical protein [Candidatus Woesearchaeota archaeon]
MMCRRILLFFLVVLFIVSRLIGLSPVLWSSDEARDVLASLDVFNISSASEVGLHVYRLAGFPYGFYGPLYLFAWLFVYGLFGIGVTEFLLVVQSVVLGVVILLSLFFVVSKW